MKTVKFLAAFLAVTLLASCGEKEDHSGDFGQIKVPDVRQLEQTAGSDDTQPAKGVTFTTEGAWTSSITQTRADGPAWITISPDHGDAAGTYTLKITLEPNTTAETREARITITCGTSKIEIVITQTGSGTPEDPDDPSIDPSPQSKWLVSRIDNVLVEGDGQVTSLPFNFEYDADRRMTKFMVGEIDITGYTISYPDARTIKINNIPNNGYQEFITVTLDEKGRATEAAIREIDEQETSEMRQTFAYNAAGYCSEIRLDNFTNRKLSSRMEFTWESGNLTAAKVFDEENQPDTEDDYTLTYTNYKNDPKLVNLDLNALFAAIPGADLLPDCSPLLSMLDRTGLRSANLANEDLMSRFDSDVVTEGDWYVTHQTVYEPIAWTIDAEGRPAKAVSIRVTTPVKIHIKTGEVVPTGKGETTTDTYEFRYTE